MRVASGGYAAISDAGLRVGAELIDRALAKFRDNLRQARRDGRVQQQGEWLNISDPALQYALEADRNACVELLNQLLKPLGLAPLPVWPPRSV